MVHSTESFFAYHFWSNWNLETLVLRRGENRITRKKPLGERERTNNKRNLHMESPLRFARTRAMHIGRRRYSYYCTTITSFQSPL